MKFIKKITIMMTVLIMSISAWASEKTDTFKHETERKNKVTYKVLLVKLFVENGIKKET